jgi:hypothetical protein
LSSVAAAPDSAGGLETSIPVMTTPPQSRRHHDGRFERDGVSPRRRRGRGGVRRRFVVTAAALTAARPADLRRVGDGEYHPALRAGDVGPGLAAGDAQAGAAPGALELDRHRFDPRRRGDDVSIARGNAGATGGEPVAPA